MDKILSQIPEEFRDLALREKQPDWLGPMLAKLTHDEFSAKNWIFERKLDGVRCIVYKNGKDVKIYSRNRNKLNNTYPQLVEALKSQRVERFIADGEIVAFKGKLTSFSELQKRMNIRDPDKVKGHNTPVFYYLFDLLHIEDLNLTDLPLLERKKILKNNIDFTDPLRFTVHRNEKGLEFLEDACRKKWEGLIAKKADSKYIHTRSPNWLKFKCSNQQEFVIGGYTEPTGSRIGFGALLLGYYDQGDLIYAGKVGTGFDDAFLNELYKKMKKLEIEKPGFSNAAEIRSRKVHWIKPKIVGQVSFTEWTRDNKLRHPSFLGLRDDKTAKDVVKEI